MTEQPKMSEPTCSPEKAVPVPGPWNWGWWSQDSETGELEFRPLSEIDEINAVAGIFHHFGPQETPTYPNVVLSHRPYGFRFNMWGPRKALAAWGLKDDGFIDESQPFGVLDAMVTIRSDRESGVGILATKPTRDLIAAAPDLLAACEEAECAIRSMRPTPVRDGGLYAAQMSCFEAVRQAKGGDNG